MAGADEVLAEPVRRPGPGACPKPELADFTRRVWMGLAQAVSVVLLKMDGQMTGLPDLLGILLSPVIAAMAMTLSSVSVVGNALRLRTARIGMTLREPQAPLAQLLPRQALAHAGCRFRGLASAAADLDLICYYIVYFCAQGRRGSHRQLRIRSPDWHEIPLASRHRSRTNRRPGGDIPAARGRR